MKSGRASFKQDTFRQKRGGWSRFLLVSCDGGDCGQPVLLYQKDGPGMLKRIYLDRIVAPKQAQMSDSERLICKHCDRILGMQITWHKEDRPVYRLFAGAVRKSVISADSLETMKQLVA